jgi:hypothetical protein
MFIVGGAFQSATTVTVAAVEYIKPSVNANAWSTGASMPFPAYGMGVALLDASTIYACGGLNLTADATSACQTYDISANKWSLGPSLPVASAYLAGATINGQCCLGHVECTTVLSWAGRIYMCGGSAGPTFVYVLNRGASIWIRAANMAQGRTYFQVTPFQGGCACMHVRVASVFIRSLGSLYALGGYLSSTAYSAVEVFDTR